ncbi:pyruvate formate-lyase-activating protein [Clostridium rectalis]|uniref:pyruvate formate-lyase-activating protein n=1 Tax=Clostridium rectalis TaxID=2040295 RepID=UPI00311A9765
MGRIHSFESMGLVDGPGIRNVVFFQGCHLRCKFCHNPDTWDYNVGTEISSNQLIEKIIRFKPYFKNGGGVTFSGGEPLLQPKFLLQMLKLCKENHIHTAIDTAGYGEGNYAEILKYVDLILLDIKHVNPKDYKKLTNKNKKKFDLFLDEVTKTKTPLWIRQVIVPNFNDSKEYITLLSQLIKNIKITNKIEKIELLPYNTLGINKYKLMNYNYTLSNTPPMNKIKCNQLQNKLINLI